jgi:hypothetical protein
MTGKALCKVSHRDAVFAFAGCSLNAALVLFEFQLRRYGGLWRADKVQPGRRQVDTEISCSDAKANSHDDHAENSEQITHETTHQGKTPRSSQLFSAL